MSKSFTNKSYLPDSNRRPELVLTKRGERVLKIARTIGALAVGALALFGISKSFSDNPDFHGSQTITIDYGDTVFGLANNIDGNQRFDTREIVEQLQENPEIADGLTPGEEVIIPQSVN